MLCIVGPRVSLQYMGLALYKPLFEKMEGSILPSHSSAGLAGVSKIMHVLRMIMVLIPKTQICTGITQAVTLGKCQLAFIHTVH